MTTIRKLFTSAVVTITLAVGTQVRADQPDKFTKPHEPFTAYGMQVRMSIINPIDKSDRAGYLPTVFQEIAPCRLTSTLSLEAYASAWGGPAYQANESRRYMGRGFLGSETFTNPCSEVIPANALGLIARFSVTSAQGDGEIHVDSTNATRADAATVLKFHKNQALMFEAGVLFAPDGSFDVATWYAGADVTIDILGYLTYDPAPAGGAQGDKGDKGEKGDKGDTGATGAAGVAGALGPKGDTGAAGAQGPKGDTGANGAAGAQGPKGDTGATGAQGPIGPIGPMGPQGLQGPKGNDGKDVSNLSVIKGGSCYPPGNNGNDPITVNDPNVTANSIIMLNYTDGGSNGNALALTGQGAGYFQTTGSPNKCFQYVILNTTP